MLSRTLRAMAAVLSVTSCRTDEASELFRANGRKIFSSANSIQWDDFEKISELLLWKHAQIARAIDFRGNDFSKAYAYFVKPKFKVSRKVFEKSASQQRCLLDHETEHYRLCQKYAERYVKLIKGKQLTSSNTLKYKNQVIDELRKANRDFDHKTQHGRKTCR